MKEFSNYEYSVIETEEGYAVNIKGDKEEIKAKLEAIKAYFEFKKKAKAAGFTKPEHCGSKKHGILSLLHDHVKAARKHHRGCE